MKKTILFTLAILSTFCTVNGQIRLDVEGEGRIEKRLILGNTTDFNLFVGYDSGINTTPTTATSSGVENTFLGNLAGRENTQGSYNVFLGFLTGYFNTTGTRNTFLGTRAGYANTTGNDNVFIGDAAGQSNTVGSDNVLVGKHAGLFNTEGSSNVFLGTNAGFFNTTGTNNSFIGHRAGESNTTGFHNIFNGKLAGFRNTTGTRNIFLGFAAGSENTIATYNTFIGDGTGYNTTTGSYNIFLGGSSGGSNLTGSENIVVGVFANTTSADLNNAIAIGYHADVDASNKIVLGNTSMTVIGGYANWMNLSDKRYKKNIKKEKNHLDFILQLDPVSYQYNTTKLVKEKQQRAIANAKAISRNKESDPTKISSAEDQMELSKRNSNELKAAQQKDKIRYSGFLAQDVEKAANKVGYGEFSGIVKPEINGGKYGLRYAEFVVPLVGAVQEQQILIEDQQAQLSEKSQEIEDLKTEVAELKALVHQLIDGQKVQPKQQAFITNATLGQNQPNPFNESTLIPYNIPNGAQSASLKVYTITGQLLRSIPIQNFGTGSIELQTDGLNNGQYTYSLEVDGQVVVTKKMSLQK